MVIRTGGARTPISWQKKEGMAVVVETATLVDVVQTEEEELLMWLPPSHNSNNHKQQHPSLLLRSPKGTSLIEEGIPVGIEGTKGGSDQSRLEVSGTANQSSQPLHLSAV